MSYYDRAHNHARAGMTAELNGMLELAVFHYEQAAFWKAMAAYRT